MMTLDVEINNLKVADLDRRIKASPFELATRLNLLEDLARATLEKK